MEVSHLEEINDADRRRAVLVLGMHRSGTSALSGVLAKLGCALPKDLMGAGIGNERGHFEPKNIVALNNRILTSAGSNWEDWTPLNPGWRSSPEYGPFLKEANQALHASFGNAPLLVMKDPRICRLANFWLAALESEQIEPGVVLCLRNPTEVAESLAARDGTEHGYAYLLWLRYMLEAEASTRGMSRAICSFDQIMYDWSGTTESIGAALNISWPRMSATSRAEIEDFIEPKSFALKEPSRRTMPDWVFRAYAILQKWTIHGEDQTSYAELDEILGSFNTASNVFSGLILPGSRSLGAGGAKAMESLKSEAKQHLTRIAALEHELNHLNQELVEARQAVEEGRTRSRGQEDLVGQLQEAKSTLEADRDDLRRTVQTQTVEAQRRAEEVADTKHRFGVLESTLHQREEEIEQTRSELAEARDLLAAKVALVDSQGVELESLRGRLDTAQGELTGANAWVFKLAGERQAARAEVASLVRRLTELQKEQARSEARAGTLQAANVSLALQSTAASREAETVRQDWRRAREELDSLHIQTEQELARQQGELISMTTRLTEAEQVRRQAEEECNRLTARNDILLQDLSTSSGQVAAIREDLHSAEQDYATLQKEHTAAVARLQHDASTAADAMKRLQEANQKELQKLKSPLAEQLQEAAVITKLLLEAERARDHRSTMLRWLSETNAALSSMPFWWHMLPLQWKNRHIHRKLLKHGLFDAQAYIALNPDVASAGMDPVRHFIEHGIHEGRDLTK